MKVHTLPAGPALAAMMSRGLFAAVVHADAASLLDAIEHTSPLGLPPPAGRIVQTPFDLTMTSPPYEDARDYGSLKFRLRGHDWVRWAADLYARCLRATDGLVAWVVDSRTKSYRWSPASIALACELDRRGFALRKPVIYHRSGIAGSGGPDWLRNDYEFVVCATRSAGRLPWSNNTACGGPPKCPPGGPPSHRTRDGSRVKRRAYVPPAIANPGNVLRCLVGRGHMGSPLAHENEAPYPVRVPDFFIRSFCPPRGLVFDPFAGSGTTAQAAIAAGRSVVLCEARADQVAVALRRIEAAALDLQS